MSRRLSANTYVLVVYTRGIILRKYIIILTGRSIQESKSRYAGFPTGFFGGVGIGEEEIRTC